MIEAGPDWAGLVDLVNDRCDRGLVLDGYAEGGDSGGAAFVRWPTGDRSVLSFAPGPLERIRLIGSVLDGIRSPAIPVPRYQLIIATDGGTVLVQERMPRDLPSRIDLVVMERIIGLCESFAELLADRPDAPSVDLHLRHSGTDLFRHDTLASYDRRTRRLLAQIREAAEDTDMVAGTDLVHCDFTPGNVLFDQDRRINAVIDWHGPNGLARGNCAFGLVVFRFDLAWGTLVDPAYPRVESDALARLDQYLDALPEHQLRRYWASMSLRMVDWTIRHHRPQDVDHQLAFAATRLT